MGRLRAGKKVGYEGRCIVIDSNLPHNIYSTTRPDSRDLKTEVATIWILTERKKRRDN